LGPSADGTVAAPGTFRGRAVRLVEAWRRPLGAGVAGVVVADGHAFTLASNDEHDEAIAFSIGDGREVWRVRLDPSVTGADRGPGSTPLVDAGRLVVLTPACQLRALDAATGRTVWHRDLKADFAVVLRQGCATSPLLEDGTLVVQGGGRENDQRVLGLDPATGHTRWTARGTERTFYTSPVMAEIGGVRQLVVHHTVVGPPPRSGLMGLRWSDRSTLWSRAFDAASFDTPMVLSGGRVLLSTWNGTHLLQVTSAGGTFTAEPLWQTDAIKAYVSPPVHLDGHLYGFGDDFLTCVTAQGGKVLWKEKLYAGSAILVDGHLVLQSVTAGLLRVAEASPAGYKERARISVFNRGAAAEAPPSFADGRIFVRNDEEIVAVSIAPAGSS
jgi:outer membrane protein assembly factor BamB